jgi:hypothetical protein
VNPNRGERDARFDCERMGKGSPIKSVKKKQNHTPIFFEEFDKA